MRVAPFAGRPAIDAGRGCSVVCDGECRQGTQRRNVRGGTPARGVVADLLPRGTGIPDVAVPITADDVRVGGDGAFEIAHAILRERVPPAR
jgi:hypothetical protein